MLNAYILPLALASSAAAQVLGPVVQPVASPVVSAAAPLVTSLVTTVSSVASPVLSVAAPATSAAAPAIGYAPKPGLCPNSTLIRPAQGLNPDEAAFVAQRYPQATKSLAAWLSKVDPAFPKFRKYPMLAMVDGGGGLRGWTISAGIHKAFDGGEPDASSYSTSGLYQAFTYESGLSGSAIMLYSYVQNNWPLTSSLLNELWIPAFENNIAMPMGGPTVTAVIGAEVLSKSAAGYATALTDLWGRILSYGSFLGANPGLTETVSQFRQLSGYTSYQKPYPIITAIGLENPAADGCGLPPLNASQYEITPHEFGSWETGIGNFVQTQYMGTNMQSGKPVALCTTGFDNVGWAAATSSSTFNQQCSGVRDTGVGIFNQADLNSLDTAYTGTLGTAQQGNYALVPNPFANLTSAPRVNNEIDLTLVDGGETIQVSPIWPFIYRPGVDTLIVSDNGADNPANYHPQYKGGANLPSGQQIWHVYEQAILNGMGARMPYIPPPRNFMSSNFNKKPMTFFGCNLPNNSPAMFIIYLPNRPIVYDSSVLASVTTYNETMTLAMIANGEAIATNNGDPMFAKCMACGIMKRNAAKSKVTLPSYCTSCFSTYCSS